MNAGTKTIAKEWLTRAESDLEYAKAGEKETPHHHVTCFLCHQSVEKSLKGLLVLFGGVPKKTHHLGLLVADAIEKCPLLASSQNDIRRLDKYYIPARYPDDLVFDFTANDALVAISVADKIVELFRKEIEKK